MTSSDKQNYMTALDGRLQYNCPTAETNEKYTPAPLPTTNIVESRNYFIIIIFSYCNYCNSFQYYMFIVMANSAFQ